MYIYNENEREIIINRFLIFKKQIIFLFCGNLNENEFKYLRLQNGLYRQKKFYMYRLLVSYGFLSSKQIYLISYILFKFDKKYLHFTTRTNIQLNWINLINIIYIFFYLIFINLNSIQTSGNCIRSITVNYNLFDKIYFENKSWGELIKQWFNLNSEFLFLPRKFKISLLSSKTDNIFLKFHDLGVLIKKNLLNNILFDIFIGGGLGRIPILGIYFFKNIHWKKIFIYSNNILKIYNINGYRNNIYKARIKILIKSISLKKFINFFKNEYNFSNNYLFLLNEKEINKILFYFFNSNYKKYYFINKKIKYNSFFLNWLNFKNLEFLKCNFNIIIILKYFNLPPGDINFLQLKIIFYIFIKNNIYFFFINNRQNIIFNINNNIFLYNIYILLKKYFFLIYNLNSLLDILCCPGKDYCNLANSESINLVKNIQYKFKDYNTIKKMNFFKINISGCINSCAHHHISELGFLGVNKNNESWYQFLIGGNNSFNNLIFSKILGPSKDINYILFDFIKLIKIYLKINKKSENFIDIYNKLNFIFFKNSLKFYD